MRDDTLLPGVTAARAEPLVRCDARGAIAQARQRRLLREVGQLALLVAADLLFLRWPAARLPWLDRGQTLNFVLMLNGLALFDLWLARQLPRWVARRIATTWSRSERERYLKPARTIR